MANELRVRADAVAGALDAALTNVATSMSSPGLADLPAIGTTEYAAITLFTRNSDGRVTAKEIVWVTAHTASATTATIVRGKESTTGVAWAIGDKWAHGATEYDINGVPQGRPIISASTYLTIPGIEAASTSTQLISSGTDRYSPFIVPTNITIDQMVCEVTSAAAASITARLGIYAATDEWQPGALIVDAGTVAVDSTGVKTITLSPAIQLIPGRYLSVINTGGSPTFRVVRGGSQLYGFSSTLSATPFLLTATVSRTYAAFPADGTDINTTLLGTTPPIHFIFYRVSVP